MIFLVQQWGMRRGLLVLGLYSWTWPMRFKVWPSVLQVGFSRSHKVDDWVVWFWRDPQISWAHESTSNSFPAFNLRNSLRFLFHECVWIIQLNEINKFRPRFIWEIMNMLGCHSSLSYVSVAARRIIMTGSLCNKRISLFADFYFHERDESYIPTLP